MLTKTTARLGVPVLLLFIVLGMIAGIDGPGRINFDNPELAKFIGSFSLSFILFSGGLDTRFADVKKVLLPGVLMSTFGVLITCVSVGVFVSLITPFTLLEGLLLGAIVSSTDAAAVFSIMRSRGLKIKGNARQILELESGSNDPMAYFLTIMFLFLLMNPEKNFWAVVPMFFQQMIVGGIIGFLAGKGMQIVINWIRLEVSGLYSVLLIGMVLLTFSGTNFLGGNAYLSVYIAALVLGNSDFIHKRSLQKHFDGIAWLMQVVLFLTLGLQVVPSEVVPHIGIGLIISFFLIMVARPLSVFMILAPFKANIRSMHFLSWVGLRGAVPIVFAMIPLTHKLPNADIIFNIVFFITITSVLLQGTSIPIVARILKLTVPKKVRYKFTPDRDTEEKMRSMMEEIVIDDNFNCVGKPIVELNLPASVLVVLVKRDKNTFFIPDGSTVLMNKDKLFVIADNRDSVSLFTNCLKARNE
jgi:cell volume regulation protein A